MGRPAARHRIACALLIAVSAGSPYLGGRRSGWSSMRQQAWYGIDQRRSGPVPPAGADPIAGWVCYVLGAPVMQVRHGELTAPVRHSVSFGSWLHGCGPVARPATLDDLDDHLTTLFPPVRRRGYLELRCLDALPDRWWPGLAAFAVTLIDDPAAADAAAELLEPIRDAWLSAARLGLADGRLARAARGCAEIALGHGPPELMTELERFCALIDAARTPADELLIGIERNGPVATMQEEAHV